ncbi:STM3941 family protein [Pannonibacter phragmitetus]|uniref:STM3941 family protein n=1 Tax=Pannonibacter phragmitetus TaxID=121719 RepID=UPI003D2EA85D
MQVDTNQTLEIKGSPLKLVGLLLAGIVMTGLSAAITFLPAVFGPALIFGIPGMLFFGACTCIALYRLAISSGVMVTISPDGIRDLRVARKMIPWGEVREVFVWSSSGQKFIILNVDPDFEKTLDLGWIPRMTRSANAKLGADGLAIAPTGIRISFDDLFEIILAHVAAAQGPWGGAAGPVRHVDVPAL